MTSTIAPEDHSPEEAPAVAHEGLEARAAVAERRRGFLLGLPAMVYLTLLFVLPFFIVGVYSFATR
ncbi:MAG: hypothetical protein KJN81_11700, partial [Acidimicrobiia bacterium]|nr:hypothetical protein [Acidimicrobiia bacterium]NNL29084.1 hypothetical protein [Acidimicrobiia bacterium]